MAAFKLPSLSLKKRRRQLSLPEFRCNSISLKEELGRRTFGTVYLAKCTGEEQCVVIKKLKGEAADAKGSRYIVCRERSSKHLLFLKFCQEPHAIMMEYSCFDFGPLGVEKKVSTLEDFFHFVLN